MVRRFECGRRFDGMVRFCMTACGGIGATQRAGMSGHSNPPGAAHDLNDGVEALRT